MHIFRNLIAAIVWGLNIVFCTALDPPGGDTVAKLRNDFSLLNTTVVDIQSKNVELEQKNSDLERQLTMLKAQKGVPVAFTVAESTNVQLGSNQVIQFDKIITNIGNGYNKYHGQFTAPVAGIYYFSFHLISGHSSNHAYVQLIKNGAELAIAYSRHNQDSGTGSAVTHLEVGDVVWVRHMTGKQTESILGNLWSSFSGVLIA